MLTFVLWLRLCLPDVSMVNYFFPLCGERLCVHVNTPILIKLPLSGLSVIDISWLNEYYVAKRIIPVTVTS